MQYKILAINTVNKLCSVALYIENNIKEIFNKEPKNHNKFILYMIDKLINDAHINLSDLNAIAVNIGPGSFIGTRIGIGIAKGLSLAINLNILGISNLEILSQRAFNKTGYKKILLSIRLNINEIYLAKYKFKNYCYWIKKKSKKIIYNNFIKKKLILMIDGYM